MNYLAHLFLSCDHPERMVGNFLADHLTLKESKSFTGAYREGIELHRWIDHFTDHHELVREGTAFLRFSQRKYAPVVIDIYFDYLLHATWNTYHSIPFEDFCIDVYQTLSNHLEAIPTRLHPRVKGMVAGQFLDSYTHTSGLSYTFQRLSQRVKFQHNLKEATAHLIKHLPYYLEIFHGFFPEIVQEVEKRCDC